MKKLMIFFIILINISSYSIGISVKTLDNQPLKEVLIKVNNQVKISNDLGEANFSVDDNSLLNITLSKDGYQEETLTIRSGETSNNITFILKEIQKATCVFNFPVSDGVIEYREVGTSTYTSVPYIGKSKSLELYYGNYEFLFSSKNTESIKKIIFVNHSLKNYSINSKTQENTFFIIGNVSKKEEINFLKNNINKIISPNDLQLTIIKNGKIIKKIFLNDTFSPVTLESGVYDFMVSGKFYDNIFFRGLKLTASTNKNIVISVPHIETKIQGTIKNNDQFLGGVLIVFTDVNNVVYKTLSDFVGNFSIDLPPQKYKITIKKPGFILSKNQNLIYDFSTPKKTYNLNLIAAELPSTIDGVIYNNKKEPLSDATVSLKNGDTFIKVKTNKFGKFSTSILPGMIFIKVEKDGYKPVGVVRKLERFSTLSGLNITLSPHLSNISGIISNDFFPLKDIPLNLRDKDGNIVASTLSNSNGYYEFSDVRIDKNYFITVGVQSYKHYFSSRFHLSEEDVTNKNIILKSRNLRVYLEVVDALENPLKNKKISINKIIYSTDSNGFLLLELPENTQNIVIRGVGYNYYNKMDLSSVYKDPYQVVIKIK